MSPFSDILCIQSWPENMTDLSVFSNLQTIQGRKFYKWAVAVFSLFLLTLLLFLLSTKVMLLSCCCIFNCLADYTFSRMNLILFFCFCICLSPSHMSFLHHLEEWTLKGTVNNSHPCLSPPCQVWHFSLKYFFLASVLLFYIFLTRLIHCWDWVIWWWAKLCNEFMWFSRILLQIERYLGGKCWNLGVCSYFMKAKKCH